MSRPLRFIIIPKVAHPWFDEVNKGAQAQAEILKRALGVDIIVDYIPPSIADVVEQNTALEKAARSHPSGIAIDPVDAVDHMTAIQRIKDEGIPVVLFDSPSPDTSFTSVGNNFAQQGLIAAERLVELVEYTGKVAIMQGHPSAPNHKERYKAQMAVLQKYPGITMVNGGIDNDDIETAFQHASATLESHPDLAGYLCCDASGPIGIANAVKKAGKVGKVQVVSMDGIKPILDAIKEGVIESSSSTIPKMQGSMSVLMLWQASLGVALPQMIDTGIEVITQENVDRYLAESL
ncbi:substrate-binding domain-containing protein [Sulfurovum sp.]|jgi:ribose transport system substrate-binding protein|uniref:substrate-binding domain-containing protein n=1 Tax=Sulfurovum sp. TaxID=1969726 RepID=UPI002A3606CC|nr:substrate-binding domain-containing protein [Sulfurovum sp.]MDD2451999.1 substrate-binding domain-containing protein [Sulfurovum sp.]MDD3500414.1 substrate-binding domain-containing protein [Sulfurovum sp.]MDY0403491.1 substrate-binding domain-containing protein [Sulfurovum sp.]